MIDTSLFTESTPLFLIGPRHAAENVARSIGLTSGKRRYGRWLPMSSELDARTYRFAYYAEVGPWASFRQLCAEFDFMAFCEMLGFEKVEVDRHG